MNAATLLIAAAIIIPPYDLIVVSQIRRSDSAPRADATVVRRAKIDVLIKPNGRVVRCDFVEGTGDKAAGQAACRTYRSSLAPAVPSLNGMPSYALLRLSAYTLDDARVQPVPQFEPDVILAVRSLPVGQMLAEVQVVLAVDELGQITTCEPFFKTGRTAMTDAVCAASSFLGVMGTTDVKGRPITYVTKRQVKLVVNGPA